MARISKLLNQSSLIPHCLANLDTSWAQPQVNKEFKAATHLEIAVKTHKISILSKHHPSCLRWHHSSFVRACSPRTTWTWGTPSLRHWLLVISTTCREHSRKSSKLDSSSMKTTIFKQQRKGEKTSLTSIKFWRRNFTCLSGTDKPTRMKKENNNYFKNSEMTKTEFVVWLVMQQILTIQISLATVRFIVPNQNLNHKRR